MWLIETKQRDNFVRQIIFILVPEAVVDQDRGIIAAEECADEGLNTHRLPGEFEKIAKNLAAAAIHYDAIAGTPVYARVIFRIRAKHPVL